MSINTTHSGDVTQDDRDVSNGGYGLFIALAAIILAPLGALAGIATWWAFSFLRIRRSVIAAGLGVYLVLLFIFSWLLIPLFIEAWTIILPQIISQELPLTSIITFYLYQTPVVLPLGVVGGLVYSSWRWITRPVWEEYKFRITPWQFWKRNKNVRSISLDEDGPLRGKTLGVTDYGDKIIQTEKEAAANTLVVGASGSGKTTLLMSMVRDAIRQGSGVCFVDLKGGKDVPEILAKYAERYDRKIYHWLLQPKTEPYTGPDPEGPAYYDPIARGDATRRKDLLIASRHWSEEHYKIQASSYLQMLFSILIGSPKPGTSTFSEVVKLLDPRALQERAIPLGSDPRYQDVVRGIDELNDSKISKTKLDSIEGLRSQLEVILHSVAGPWLQVDHKDNHNVNLKNIAHKGDIVIFSLDSSNYQELSALVANLIIQDLKTASSELRDDPTSKPFQVFIDEFSAIGSDNIIGLINKSRDANMPVTFSTQALGDLRKVDPTFLDQVVGIINSFVIHRANTEDDAELFAGLTGITRRKKFRQSVEHSKSFFGLGRGVGTGSGTLEDVDEFRIMPNEIQDLKIGQNIYLTKSPFRLERVNVIPEKDVSTGSDARVIRTPTVAEAQKAITVPVLASSIEEVDADGVPLLENLYENSDTDSFSFAPSSGKSNGKPNGGNLVNILNKGLSTPASPQPLPTLKSAPAKPSTGSAPKDPADSRKPGKQPFPTHRPTQSVPAKENQKSEPSSPIIPTTPRPPKKDEFSF